MTALIPSLARRTLQRLIRAFSPEKVILFGSYAKGNTHNFSDIDLLLVTTKGGHPVNTRKRAKQLAADSFPQIDVVFATVEEYENPALLKSTFLSTILVSSIVIYDKTHKK